MAKFLMVEGTGVAVTGDGKPFIETGLFNTEVDHDDIIEDDINVKEWFANSQEFIEKNYEIARKCFLMLNMEAAIHRQNEKEVLGLDESQLVVKKIQ